jgi:hypothetical protein
VNAWLRSAPWYIYLAGMLVTNVLLGLVVAEFLRSYSRREQEKTEGPAQPAVAGQ